MKQYDISLAINITFDIRYFNCHNLLFWLIGDLTMSRLLSPADRRRMDNVSDGLPTKSAKIRALDAAGYTRSQIAAYLNIRYQHVRNVLVQRHEKAAPKEVSVSIGPGGRIVIPAVYRQALGLNEGDQVMLSMVDDEVRLTSRLAKIREAQDLVAKYVPEDVSLVDELIAERRREAAREESGG